MIGKFIVGEVVRRVAGDAIEKGVTKGKKIVVDFLTEEETKKKIAELEGEVARLKSSERMLSERLQKVQEVTYEWAKYGPGRNEAAQVIINATWGK